jgi:OOP family OmpA-OmpF porin
MSFALPRRAWWLAAWYGASGLGVLAGACTPSVTERPTTAQNPDPPPSGTPSLLPPPSSATASASAKPAEPPTEKKIQGDLKGTQVLIPGGVSFEGNKDKIDLAKSKPALDQVKAFLENNPQVTLLRVEGHTSSDGDDMMNLKLSAARALAVVTYLAENGVARDRLVAIGFGETKPLVLNDTPANKEKNLRTEFHIAQVAGKNFLGHAPDGGGTLAR